MYAPIQFEHAQELTNVLQGGKHPFADAVASYSAEAFRRMHRPGFVNALMFSANAQFTQDTVMLQDYVESSASLFSCGEGDLD